MILLGIRTNQNDREQSQTVPHPSAQFPSVSISFLGPDHPFLGVLATTGTHSSGVPGTQPRKVQGATQATQATQEATSHAQTQSIQQQLAEKLGKG